MAEDQDKESKTEEPTEKKIRDAVEKGNIPFSKEVPIFALLQPPSWSSSSSSCRPGRPIWRGRSRTCSKSPTVGRWRRGDDTVSAFSSSVLGNQPFPAAGIRLDDDLRNRRIGPAERAATGTRPHQAKILSCLSGQGIAAALRRFGPGRIREIDGQDHGDFRHHRGGLDRRLFRHPDRIVFRSCNDSRAHGAAPFARYSSSCFLPPRCWRSSTSCGRGITGAPSCA